MACRRHLAGLQPPPPQPLEGVRTPTRAPSTCRAAAPSALSLQRVAAEVAVEASSAPALAALVVQAWAGGCPWAATPLSAGC